MATNCIQVPRFLAQAAPRAVPGWLMCNSSRAALDSSAGSHRDMGTGMHQHGTSRWAKMGRASAPVAEQHRIGQRTETRAKTG